MTRAPAEVGSAANSYEILAKLAIGGMAEIFLARGASAAGVERYVVLKRVLGHRADDEHFVQMFLDEARLAAQLQHPNIAQVYDIGKLGDSFFFTMEYVHGETVRTLLQRSHGLRRLIPIGSVLTIVAGAAAGLHHAHDRKGMDGVHLGIVHRDVSPSNLMVSYEGTVKVVDFGVAKAAHRSTETQSGTVKGKICYMSPEQCRGGQIDRRSDLFSLGIVMWEMLTTERLFRRASDFENMQAIVNDQVPPPSALRPEVPPEIDHIVMRLLAKNPDDRYQTADELHEAIENAAMRTSSVLSTVSLGRYFRELFGQRPEPWIELTSFERHPEAFTVTSEPIPSFSADLDLKLSEVPELPRMSAQHTSAQTPQAKIGPTVPLRVEVEDLNSTMPRPGGMSRHNVVPFEGPVPPPLAPSYPVSQSGAMRPRAPSTTPSGQASFPVQYSQAVHGAYRQPQKKPRRSRAMFIIIPAIVVGVGIGLVLALRSDDAPKPVTAKQEKPRIEQPAPPPPPPPPAVVAEPEPVVAAPEPEPVAAAVPEKPTAKPGIDELFKAKSYKDVVAMCAAAKSEVAQHAALCTVSACKAKENSKARRWFASVASSKKNSVAKECGGVVRTEKEKPAPDQGSAVEDPCKRDFMACQH